MTSEMKERFAEMMFSERQRELREDEAKMGYFVGDLTWRDLLPKEKRPFLEAVDEYVTRQ